METVRTAGSFVVLALLGGWACRSEIPSKAPPARAAETADELPQSTQGATVAQRAVGTCHNEDFSSCEYACDDAAWSAVHESSSSTAVVARVFTGGL